MIRRVLMYQGGPAGPLRFSRHLFQAGAILILLGILVLLFPRVLAILVAGVLFGVGALALAGAVKTRRLERSAADLQNGARVEIVERY